MTQRACVVPECGRRHYGHGYCRAHHARWLRHGHPQADLPLATGGVGYWACHRRVTAVRGPASTHRCAGCEASAVDWFYDGTDPVDRTDSRGRRYSLDPASYRARCRFCQRRAEVDQAAPFPPVRRRAELDAARAEQLYRAGASSRGIAALMGVSRGVVLRALRARAVPIRPPVAPQRRPRRYPVTPRPAPATTRP